MNFPFKRVASGVLTVVFVNCATALAQPSDASAPTAPVPAPQARINPDAPAPQDLKITIKPDVQEGPTRAKAEAMMKEAEIKRRITTQGPTQQP